jgi:hypothetical protein
VKSTEKIRQLTQGLGSIEAEDEETARLIGLAGAVIPTLEMIGGIPEDPEQLDGMLETLAGWALKARSDDAELLIVVPCDRPGPPAGSIVAIRKGAGPGHNLVDETPQAEAA